MANAEMDMDDPDLQPGGIKVEEVKVIECKPEWIRMKDVPKIFGVGRGKLYDWMNGGKLRHVSLREPGQMHATRLISWASLSTLLESMAEGGEA